MLVVMGEIIAPVRQGLLSRGSSSSALHPRLDVLAGDIVIEKPRFGAFHSTDLELILATAFAQVLTVQQMIEKLQAAG
jgi:nicotinamidase-related amidase